MFYTICPKSRAWICDMDHFLITEIRNTYTILDKNPHSEALLGNRAYKSG